MLKRIGIAILILGIVVAIWQIDKIKEIVQDTSVRLTAFAGVPLCTRCNIILVSVDVFRADDLPCYGYFRNTAPNLCAFARQNTFLTNFYSNSSYTMDDHVSMFTGLYPSSHHMLVPYRDALNPSIPSLAETLRANGYKTIYLGATEDPNLPLDKGIGRGFDEIHSLGGGDDLSKQLTALLPRMQGNSPSFLFVHSYLLHSPYLPGNGPRLYPLISYPQIPVTEDEYYVNTIPFYELVLTDFHNRLAGSNSQGSYSRNKYIADQLTAAIEANDVDKAQRVFDTLTWPEKGALYELWYLRSLDINNKDMMAYLRSLYDEKIHEMDTYMKPLLSYAEKSDVRKNTIVIITSDHGEEFAEHGQFEHDNNAYNTTTYVPFIISAPNIIRGARNSLAQMVDVYPTLLDFIGIRPTAKTDGKSILSYLTGADSIADTYAISEYRGDSIQTIQDGQWKYYENRPDPTSRFAELYNIVSDPQEQKNLIHIYPDRANKMKDMLSRKLSASPHYAPDIIGFPDWIDSAKQKKLIETGYF